MKVALITGITGQDGSYLAELLIEKGYEVHGLLRRSSSFNTGRIEHLYLKDWIRDQHQGRALELHYADLTDTSSLISVISKVQPDEIYNLGAQSHVAVSFEVPEYTAEVDAVGVLRLLEAVKICGLTHKTRIYQASTSELFGKVEECPQSETTPFHPYSPYAVAKQYAYWIVKEYREAYGMYACNGILFNHESPRRGENFVTRKISQAVANIVARKQDCLYLGNLNSLRDWGHARDYVEGMWKMLQQNEPKDYVLATGEQHSVREFVEEAFKLVGILIEWRGVDKDEVGINSATGKVVVAVDPKFYRPTDVVDLLGDPTKAKVELDWTPKTTFKELVQEMVASDINKLNLGR